MTKPGLPMIFLAALAGCATTPPAAVSRRAEAIEQIRAAEDEAIQAFGKRDAEHSAAMYAPDATVMMTNMPSVKGADIKPLLKEMMADPNFSLAFTTGKIEATASGDLGYTRGAYKMTMTDPKSKKVLRESGKYLTVYAKQPDGKWRMVDDMNNPDAPALPVDSKQ